MEIAKARLLLTISTLFLFSACASIRVSEDQFNWPREIKVCALIDDKNPPGEALVRKALHNVSQEYQEKIGVAFEIIGVVPFTGDPEDWAVDIWPRAIEVCSKYSEIFAIFTNKKVFNSEDGEEGESAGYSNDYYGILIIYNVAGRSFVFLDDGSSALERTLKHELAHLFGLEHTEDKESFMYYKSNKSVGKWTDGTLELLRKNRTRRWR